jgi:hypothetical protein
MESGRRAPGTHGEGRGHESQGRRGALRASIGADEIAAAFGAAHFARELLLEQRANVARSALLPQMALIRTDDRLCPYRYPISEGLPA